MTKRMLMATLALLGFFVALYLALYKMGFIGSLNCSIGSCETVNLSKWATMLGLPIAAWGVGYYLVVFVVAMLAVQERNADSPAYAVALTLLTGWGVLFSLWLTYLELFQIKAICMWCVISAIIVTLTFLVSLLELRDVNRARRASV